MDLPFEFIEQALKNRHRIMGSTTQQEATISSWNTEIVRKECEVCHKVMTSDLEVHHIKERASAENGICSICHDKVHSGAIEIGEVKMTSDGPEREIIKEESSVSSKEEKKSQKKSKWSEEELQTIMDTLRKYSTLSLKSVRAHLSSKHEIEISEGILGKMRKEL
jgi:5-methylcytosine-specific restriction endonuclease McrA